MAKNSSFFNWQLNSLISRTLPFRNFTLKGASLTTLGYESGDVMYGIPSNDSTKIKVNSFIKFKDHELGVNITHPVKRINYDAQGMLYFLTQGPNNRHQVVVYPDQIECVVLGAETIGTPIFQTSYAMTDEVRELMSSPFKGKSKSTIRERVSEENHKVRSIDVELGETYTQQQYENIYKKYFGSNEKTDLMTFFEEVLENGAIKEGELTDKYKAWIGKMTKYVHSNDFSTDLEQKIGRSQENNKKLRKAEVTTIDEFLFETMQPEDFSKHVPEILGELELGDKIKIYSEKVEKLK